MDLDQLLLQSLFSNEYHVLRILNRKSDGVIVRKLTKCMLAKTYGSQSYQNFVNPNGQNTQNWNQYPSCFLLLLYLDPYTYTLLMQVCALHNIYFFLLNLCTNTFIMSVYLSVIQ